MKNSWVIFLKDLKLDLRNLEDLLAMLFFSLIIIMVFSFALPVDEKSRQALAPGVYWVTFLLAGILGLNKSFQVEKDNNCMASLLLAPISRGSIFLGKMTGNVLFILMIQAIVIPIFSTLFYSSFLSYFSELILLSLVTSIGFSSLGTLLSGLTTDLRFREIILPILLFPLLVPLLLASVKITGSITSGRGIIEMLDWLKLLIGFDLIFLIISYLTFEFVMEL